MLRILLTLLAANLLVFLWLRGSFDSYLTGGRDPDRLNQQVDAERLRVAPLGRGSGAGSANAGASAATGSTPAASSASGSSSTADGGSSGAKGVDQGAANTARPADSPTATANPAPSSTSLPAGTAASPGTTASAGTSAVAAGSLNGPSPIISNLLACSEYGPLDAAMLAKARQFFSEHAPYFVSEIEPIADSISYLVYSAPVENLAAAQRKFADFKRQGFEGINIITEGPLQNGMSFGTVRTEALAKAMIERLTRRGVRSLKIDSGGPDGVKSTVRFRYQAGEQGLPADVTKDLASLSTDLGLKPANCSPKSVPPAAERPVARPAARPATKP